ncbi:hypothetical protein AB6A40_008026 [Gnathostoma spinigerum]|uniref:Palmitoyltransferase n=1 Tax=Gnathostoma spinigerum TaxID=75299 RepID=A0ABD6EXB0_9BILA
MVVFKERLEMIREIWEQDSSKPLAFCSTCLIKRPIRSKHCAICDRCIRGFDHHCPWIANCVGESNHLFFVIYIFTVAFSTLLVMMATVYYWRDSCGGLSYRNIAFCNPWVTYVFILCSFFFISTGSILVLQIYQILYGMTTNERLNAHRYTHFHEDGNLSKSNIRSPFSDRCPSFC